VAVPFFKLQASAATDPYIFNMSLLRSRNDARTQRNYQRNYNGPFRHRALGLKNHGPLHSEVAGEAWQLRATRSCSAVDMNQSPRLRDLQPASVKTCQKLGIADRSTERKRKQKGKKRKDRNRNRTLNPSDTRTIKNQKPPTSFLVGDLVSVKKLDWLVYKEGD